MLLELLILLSVMEQFLCKCFFAFNNSHIMDIRSASVTSCSVPSRVRNLRKMRSFWANFNDFELEINIIKCKTEKLKQKT